MARPRRLFGPLTYATLALGLLACGYSAYTIHWPEIEARRDLRRAVAQLGSADPAERSSGVQFLQGRPVEIHRPLFLAMLGDGRAEVRHDGASALVGSRADPAGLAPILIRLAGDRDLHVRLEATTGLGSVVLDPSRTWTGSLPSDVRQAALSRLRDRLVDPAPEVREAAAEALTQAGPDEESASRLVATLADYDRGVRLAAIKALLPVRGKAGLLANEALVALVVDPLAQLDRAEGAALLARATDPANDEAALGLAALLRSQDDAIRIDALHCLGLIGPRARAALPALEAFSTEGDARYRAMAIDVILAIEAEGSPRALAIRLEILGDLKQPVDRRTLMLDKLRSGDPARLQKAADILLGQLADPDKEVRFQALQMLGTVILETPVAGPRLPASLPPR